MVLSYFLCVLFFFKQKTAYEMRISDWSSDVCSSDLPDAPNWISLGALAALAQAFTWGVELVLIRFAAVRDAPERALVVVNGTACLILAAAMLWLWRPLPLGEALTLLAMGPVAILGQYCNIRGFQLASTAQLVPVSYSGLVDRKSTS